VNRRSAGQFAHFVERLSVPRGIGMLCGLFTRGLRLERLHSSVELMRPIRRWRPIARSRQAGDRSHRRYEHAL